MDDVPMPTKTSRRSLIVDGPPFVGVAMVFLLLVTTWLGSGQPALGMAVLATGLVVTLALEFREWLASTRTDRRAAERSFPSLPARLERARARQIERDRWQ